MDELDDIPTFAKRLKTKFPEYQDIDDVELVERTVRKHPTYAAQVKLPPEFSLLQTTSGYKNLDEVYEKAGRDHNVDPNLLIEQGRIETVNFSPDVVYGRRNSPAGAQGAGQFMPGTAPLYGVKDRTDPIQSINGQAKYMRKLLDQFDGNEDLALAGYNAGEYRDSLKNGQVPKIKETQEYVKLIGGGLKKVREKGLTLNNFYKPQVSTGDVPQQPQDPGTIYGMTDADIKGGATTSPTFATPQPVSTDPVPETPETLQAQVASTFDANSPKSMTLLTNGNPANNFILSMSEAKRLTRVNTPNGIVLVNTKKLGIKPSEATEYVKKNGFAKDSGFVIDMGDNTGDGQPAVVAVDPNTGKEVFAAVTPTPESAQVQAQKNAAMFPGTVQVPTNTDEVVANRVGEMPLDPNIIATADPNQGGAYQGQLPQDINAQLGMQTPMVKQPVGKRQKVGQRPSQQSGTVNFDVDPNDPGVQAALAAQAADPNAKLINRPVGGVKMQEIDSRDANAVSKAYADVINIPANIKTRDEAAKYAGDYLRAKYPNGNFSFSGANSFPTGWNPGDPIGIEYDTLTKAGVDIAPDLAQKVVENRTENPKPNLQVGKNWVQEDAEWLNSNAGKALDLVNPLFGFLDDDTKNTIASSAIGGAIGSGSRVGDAVAGIARWNPLFEMAKPLTGDLSAKMREMSKPGAELELKSGDKSVTSTLFKVAGAAPGDLSRLILLTRFGGAITGGSGVVVGMAADQGLQSAGRQESPWEVAKQTGKGAIIGTIFAAAPTIGKIGGSAVAGGKLAKGFSKEAFTASTIAGGTYATEKAFGTPEDQATQAAIINTLFHLTNTGVKLAGKTIQARDSRGKETNAYVDPDGNIKLLKGEVKKPDVEMYVEAEKGADGVYRAKGDTSPDRVVEEPYSVGNRGNVIGTSREPAQLAEKNPYRIPTAKPEAVAKAAEDPRVQKLATILKTGEPLSLDDLKKASRYSPENVADAVDTLVQAKLVEILPDNTVRLIGEAPGKANVNLFEKYTNPQVDAPVTEVGSQTSVKPVQKPVNTKPSVVSDIAQNEPVSETIDTSVYESLPEQKPQVAEVVKPRAEVITEARPDTAKTLSVFTERGTKAAIEPKVVDASDLLTSADEGYPEQYQPRDRSRTASKAQIAKIASDLNPEFLGDSPKAGDGRPLVVPVMIDGKKKYAVISGNGRTEAIREAYNAGNDGSKAYMEYVGSKGKHEGDKPVYVGILDPNETDLSKFAHEANEQAQARMSPTEQAKADADRMDAGTMAAFIPADDGSIHREANRDFIRGFFDNTVTDAERGAYVQEDGSLNQDGLNRVRNAIFAKAFGDTKAGMAAIQRMAESTSDSVKNVTNALLGRAPHFAAYKDAAGQGMRHKDYDIGNDLMAAVAQYANLRSPDAKIKSVDEYIAQGNMFGAETTPFQTRVMQVLDTYKRSPKAIKAILGNYLAAADAVGNPNQINIFGQNERPSVESLLEGAVKAYESSISVEPAQESLLDQNQGREAEQVGSPQGRQVTQKVGSEDQPQGIATRTVEESKPEPPKSESGPADPPKPPTRFATTIPDPERPTPAERDIKAIPLSVKRSMVRREMAKPDADAKLIADAYGLTVEQVENTRQLGPVGKYGQMSHILRKAMADDLELLNKFAKVILPEARVNDNNPLFGTQDAASAILDKIAELAGYGRSSEMGKEGLNKFLDTFADKLPFEAVVLVHDAINHYEEWYRKRQAFAEDIAHSPLMDDIVRQSEQMGKPVITSFKDTPALNTMKKDLRPLSLRARILAIGKKYEIETGADGTRHTGLSRPVIESTFNQVLERELRKRTDFRIGEAGTGKTGETVDRTGKAESEEVDILFAHGDFDGMEDIAGNRLQSAFNSAKRELEQYQYYTDELKAGRRGSSTFGDTEQTELSARKRAFKDAELAWNKYQNDLPKAPNGKPSNLPPHLHKMVRTKAFINWFGDWLKDPANASQAVDENGEPKVLIHGTPTGGFTRFDTGQIGKRSDTSGIHFTDQRSVARTYSGTHDNFVPATSFEDAGIQIEDDGYGYFEIIDPNGDVFEGGFNTRRQAESAAKREFKAGNIPTEEAAANYEAFLNLRPPVMDIDLRQGNWSDEIYWSEKKQQFYTKNEYGDTGYDQGPLPRDAEFYAYNINDLVKQSQDMDDTGLIVRNVTDDGGEMGSNYHGGDSNQYIVFDSKNIKSIYNRGKFSPSNDNILFTNAFDQTDLFGNPVSPITSQGSLFDMGEPVKKAEVDLAQFVDKKTADFLRSLEKSGDKSVAKAASTIIGSARYARSKDAKTVIEDASDALDAFSRAKHAHTTVANILKQQTFDKQTVGEMLSPRSTKLAEAMEAGHLGRTLNGELNDSNVQFMVAWHGSPHTFDKFTTDKIGEGEGNQEYGYGLYFAEAEHVADWYKQKLTADAVTVLVGGKEIAQDSEAAKQLAETLRRQKAAIRYSDSSATDAEIVADEKDRLRALIKAEESRANGSDRVLSVLYDKRDLLKQWAKGGISFREDNAGSKYRVNLKPEADEYLLWDKPLSEQSEKIKQAIRDLRDEYRGAGIAARNWASDKHLKDFPMAGAFYKHVEDTINGDPKQVSEDMRAFGIRGIKYLDGSSRGKGEGSYNYVIFDDADVEITDIQFDANAKSVKRENFKAKQMIKAARALSPLAVSHRAKVSVDPKTRLLQAENMEALAVIHEAVRAIDPEKYGRMSFSGASFTPRAAQELLDVFNSAVNHASAIGNGRVAAALSKIGNAVEAAIDPKHGDLVVSINIPSLPQLSKHTAQEELSHRNNRRSGAKDIFADIAVTPSIQKSLANLGPGYARIGVTNAVDEVIAKSFRDDAEVELNLSAEEIDSNLDDLMTALAENNIDLAQYATGVENVSKRGKQFAETARQRGERDVQTEPQRTAESDLTTRSTSPIRETGTDSGTRTRTDSEDDRFAKLRQTELSTASGGGSLALRTPSEIALAIPKYEDLLDDEEETKTKLRKAIELIYDGKRDVSVPEAAMNIIRTGYLAGFSVIKTNLVGNSANIVIEQGAKPAMALADILNAKLNPKAKGMRYVPGLSIGDIVVGIFGNNGLISEGIFGNPIETAKTAAKNANTASEKTSFRKEFGKEYRTKRGVIPGMLYGVGEIEASRVDMNISEAKNPNFVRNTGVPLIDAVIEATKRLVVTVDRPFKSFARTADLRGLSRIGAKNFEKQTNPDASFFDQKWRKAMKKFQQDPSLLMYDLAERYAETVTFQNPNAVTDVYDKFRKLLLDEKQLAKLIPTAAQHRLAKHLGGAAYVASGSFAPFVKTPTNIGFRTLEYIFPTGVVSAAWKFYKIGQGYERTHWMEETAEARARLVSAIAGKRGQMDQAFRAETRKYTDGFKRRKEQKVAEFDAKIQSVENSRVLTDVAKKQRIADIKADKAKWLETWKEKKDKYIETREEEFETIDNRRRVADMKTKDEWNAEDMFAEAKFHAFENRQFAEAAGRMTFGTVVGGLLLLGVIKGMIDAVGVTDYDDEKGKWYAKRAAGIPDTSVKIGPYRFPFNQTPFGLAMNMGINQIEQFERPGSNYNRTGAMVKRLGKDTMALNPLTTGEFTKDDFNSWAGSKANSLTPILNMKVLSEVAEIIDEKPRKYWDEGFAAQYLIHVPGLRENLPVSKNALGGDAERGNIVRRLLRAVDPLKTVREQKSQRTLPKTPLDPKPPKN